MSRFFVYRQILPFIPQKVQFIINMLKKYVF